MTYIPQSPATGFNTVEVYKGHGSITGDALVHLLSFTLNNTVRGIRIFASHQKVFQATTNYGYLSTCEAFISCNSWAPFAQHTTNAWSDEQWQQNATTNWNCAFSAPSITTIGSVNSGLTNQFYPLTGNSAPAAGVYNYVPYSSGDSTCYVSGKSVTGKQFHFTAVAIVFREL